MKSKIAMFNLNRKSTFRSTLPALMLALLLGGAGFLGSPAWAAEIKGFSSEAAKNAGPEYGGTITQAGWKSYRPPSTWDPADWVWTLMIWYEPYLQQPLGGDFLNKGPHGTNEFAFNNSAGPPLSFQDGRLAESWTLPDENTLIFKLRKGIMWNEVPGVMASRELTAEDFAYSWGRNLASEAKWGSYDPIESVTATDKYTVEFKFTSYMPDWWFNVSGHLPGWVYPRELVKAGIGDWKNHRGIGTGPFMLDDYVEGSHVSYVRNPNYWETATINGKEYKIPFIDRLVLSLVGDKTTQTAALRTGRVDMQDEVDLVQVESLKATNPEMKFTSRPSNSKYFVAMRLDTEPFDDLRVRKAMSMAIDRKGVIAAVWDGGAGGELLDFPFAANMPESFYTPLEKLPKSTQEQFEYNPERARQLLAEAGLPNGFKTTFSSYAMEPFGDLSELLVAYWQAIGVDVSIELHEQTSMDAMFIKKNHAPLAAHTKDTTPEPYHVPQQVYINPGNIKNTSIFAKHPEYPELKEMFDRAYGTLDPVESEKIMKELGQKLLAAAPYIILPTPDVAVAYQPWLENYYGETCEKQAHAVSRIFAHAWINSALKQELTGN